MQLLAERQRRLAGFGQFKESVSFGSKAMAMTLTKASLVARLEALADDSPPKRYVVGFSGGLDSTVLLHALATRRIEHGDTPILAVHVDHGLQPEGLAAWSASIAVDAAAALGAGVESACTERVQVTPDGEGIEAAARRARYACLRGLAGRGRLAVVGAP